MADQVDGRQNMEEEDVKTAVEIPKFRKVENRIEWSKLDEEFRLAYNKRVENSQKPSMWEYDSKGGVPTELANLDPSTFLTSPLGQILCSLPKNVFARICAKLSVSDFLHLSLTCRFLHWRMFTFCTCYVPYDARMKIRDMLIRPGKQIMRVPPKSPYILNQDALDEVIEDDRTEFMEQYISQQIGQRCLLVSLPFCLRRPFFFETLELQLVVPLNCKLFYDRCLPYILSVRGLARHLIIVIYNMLPETHPFNIFNDTNDFFTTTNASYFENLYSYERNANQFPIRSNVDIYINCPYARQMRTVWAHKGNSGEIFQQSNNDILNVPVFENSIGVYALPLDATIIATLKNFLTGSKNLIFHQYFGIEKRNGRQPLIDHLFEQFGEFEEFFYEDSDENYHMWKNVVATKNGGQIRIIIGKGDSFTFMAIGKEEMFEKMDRKYGMRPIYADDSIWWKMETAVEPDESDESEEPETESSTDDCQKQDEPEESDDEEKSGETDESDRDKKEQEASGACLCLTNISCSIQ